ncbi:MAG: DNA-3-methyladenine glycosylase [Parcubacteria group bacterium]|nr:DNA-3-methyladenine glycosylase [Parcubacteria group bacterium]
MSAPHKPQAPLLTNFFDRPVLEVTPELLGKFLVRRVNGKTMRHRITEVEAYDGEQDKACHASRGRTPRTEVMYGAAGHWYVYLCYGMHEMLNIVTGPKEYPAAVLIRGVEGVHGPGRVTQLCAIGRTLNAKPATKKSGLWIEDGGMQVPKKEIVQTPRIGVSYAGAWAKAPYRYIWKKKISKN